MTRLSFGTVAAVAGLVAAIGLMPLSAAAQSDRELREQNQRLETQVKDLQAELAAARQQIADLQKQMEKLKEQGPARPTPPAPKTAPPAPPEKVTIDESIANASPRALFSAIAESYKKTLADVPAGDDTTKDGRKQRATYLASLDQWIGGANRQFRSQIDWAVMRTDLQQIPPETTSMELQAVDPQTRAKLGRPFTVSITKSQMDRLRTVQDRQKLDLLSLRGVLDPRIMVNAEMAYAGPFDADRFLGPFAEFGFAIKVKSLTVPEPPAAPAAPDSRAPQPR